jgi:hypothetical protein
VAGAPAFPGAVNRLRQNGFRPAVTGGAEATIRSG